MIHELQNELKEYIVKTETSTGKSYQDLMNSDRTLDSKIKAYLRYSFVSQRLPENTLDVNSDNYKNTLETLKSEIDAIVKGFIAQSIGFLKPGMDENLSSDNFAEELPGTAIKKNEEEHENTRKNLEKDFHKRIKEKRYETASSEDLQSTEDKSTSSELTFRQSNINPGRRPVKHTPENKSTSSEPDTPIKSLGGMKTPATRRPKTTALSSAVKNKRKRPGILSRLSKNPDKERRKIIKALKEDLESYINVLELDVTNPIQIDDFFGKQLQRCMSEPFIDKILPEETPEKNSKKYIKTLNDLKEKINKRIELQNGLKAARERRELSGQQSSTEPRRITKSAPKRRQWKGPQTLTQLGRNEGISSQQTGHQTKRGEDRWGGTSSPLGPAPEVHEFQSLPSKRFPYELGIEYTIPALDQVKSVEPQIDMDAPGQTLSSRSQSLANSNSRQNALHGETGALVSRRQANQAKLVLLGLRRKFMNSAKGINPRLISRISRGGTLREKKKNLEQRKQAFKVQKTQKKGKEANKNTYPLTTVPVVPPAQPVRRMDLAKELKSELETYVTSKKTNTGESYKQLISKNPELQNRIQLYLSEGYIQRLLPTGTKDKKSLGYTESRKRLQLTIDNAINEFLSKGQLALEIRLLPRAKKSKKTTPSSKNTDFLPIIVEGDSVSSWKTANQQNLQDSNLLGRTFEEDVEKEIEGPTHNIVDSSILSNNNLPHGPSRKLESLRLNPKKMTNPGNAGKKLAPSTDDHASKSRKKRQAKERQI